MVTITEQILHGKLHFLSNIGAVSVFLYLEKTWMILLRHGISCKVIILQFAGS